MKPVETNTKKKESKFKPFGKVIQICPDCGKIDVSYGHEKECNPVYQLNRMKW